MIRLTGSIQQGCMSVEIPKVKLVRLLPPVRRRFARRATTMLQHQKAVASLAMHELPQRLIRHLRTLAAKTMGTDWQLRSVRRILQVREGSIMGQLVRSLLILTGFLEPVGGSVKHWLMRCSMTGREMKNWGGFPQRSAPS
jgi:hypothetical protein